MTREDAFKEHREIDKNNKWFNYDLQLLGLIEKIYDDFESRTCENCKYARCPNNDYSDVWCTFGILEDVNVSRDFGCNNFEIKDKKWNVMNQPILGFQK